MNKASLFLWLFLIAAGLSLAGCGKVSNPVPPEGSAYPHSYPRK